MNNSPIFFLSSFWWCVKTQKVYVVDLCPSLVKEAQKRVNSHSTSKSQEEEEEKGKEEQEEERRDWGNVVEVLF